MRANGAAVELRAAEARQRRRKRLHVAVSGIRIPLPSVSRPWTSQCHGNNEKAPTRLDSEWVLWRCSVPRQGSRITSTNGGGYEDYEVFLLV